MFENFVRGFYLRYITKDNLQAIIIFILIVMAAIVALLGAYEVFFFSMSMTEKYLINPSNTDAGSLLAGFGLKLLSGVYGVGCYITVLYGLFNIKTILRRVRSWVKEVAEHV
jgi:glucan phosphoethanolaminetransferase (alkaline phosphatase superfamily)